MQIELKGPFKNVLQFIEILEKSKVIIPVSELNMRTFFSQSSGNPTDFSTTLNGNIYVSQVER